MLRFFAFIGLLAALPPNAEIPPATRNGRSALIEPRITRLTYEARTSNRSH